MCRRCIGSECNAGALRVLPSARGTPYPEGTRLQFCSLENRHKLTVLPRFHRFHSCKKLRENALSNFPAAKHNRIKPLITLIKNDSFQQFNHREPLKNWESPSQIIDFIAFQPHKRVCKTQKKHHKQKDLAVR